MDKKILEKIKNGLLAKKQEIEEELEKTKNESGTEKPEYGDKEDENAAEVAELSDNLSIEDSLEHSLHDIVKALGRIDDESYGVCKYCGRPIDEKRLLARPVSSACISCKNKISKI